MLWRGLASNQPRSGVGGDSCFLEQAPDQVIQNRPGHDPQPAELERLDGVPAEGKSPLFI
jgi:hypothetical protein